MYTHSNSTMSWYSSIVLLLLANYISSNIVKIRDRYDQNIIPTCNARVKYLRCRCQSNEKPISLHEDFTSPDVRMIEITNCKNVVFEANAIRNKTSLKSVTLKDISNLILEEFSIYKNVKHKHQTITVTIANSNIHRVPSFSFKGMSMLQLVNVTINHISPFAFNSITNMNSIRFFATKVNHIKSQAFRKITTQHLIMNGCNFNSVATKAFSNLYVKQNMFVMYSNFSNVKRNAFMIPYTKQMNITNSNFHDLKNGAFNIQTASISLRNVHFSKANAGVFANIRSPRGLGQTPKFSLNFVTFSCFNGKNLKINRNSFQPDFKNVYFHTPDKKCG